MKTTTTSFFVLMISLCLHACEIRAQDRATTNTSALKALARAFEAEWNDRRTPVFHELLAGTNPAARSLNRNPGIELMYMRKSGVPVYFGVLNLVAAQTISTDEVWPGGGSGHGLTGVGTLSSELAIFDIGEVLVTHQEFGGRVTQVAGDFLGPREHPTLVAGTMIAAGVHPDARGMSYQAPMDAYAVGSWAPDLYNMATAAANGLRVSNHSYGAFAGWYLDGDWYWYGDVAVSTLEDHLFGFYDDHAQAWDEIAREAPYYLIVKSAGNDRDDSGPGPGGGHWVWDGYTWVWSTATRNPDGAPGGYDCIPTFGVAKNALIVGAVQDIPNGYSQPSDVVQTAFSSWGPADDGRIKPDIVANGDLVYSCSTPDDTSYVSASGTSAASPSVSGSANLLLRHFENVCGHEPLSSTTKAIILHTADEAGPAPGPDYQNGWGLMNTWKAADLIAAGNLVTEAVLENFKVGFYRFTLDLPADIRATIVWTDPAGTPPPASLDPPAPMLVNDLDMRIERLATSDIYEPWILDRANPTNPASTGDNAVDNVEQVFVEDAPAGEYGIWVTHKGTLTGGPQNYSLVVSVEHEFFDVTVPFVESILDVPNDQGRWVRISFNASWYDDPASSIPIVQYEIFRRIDPLPGEALVSEPTAPGENRDRETAARRAGMISAAGTLFDEWEYAGSILAHGEPGYHIIVPTLADSTISQGMHRSVFFVRAATAHPWTYFDSAPDSGYSLDNLPPASPQGFSVAYNSGSGNSLWWDACPDFDLRFFTIYRSEQGLGSGAVEPSALALSRESGWAVVHQTIDTEWTDMIVEGWRYSYRVSAVDFSGNESDPASPETVVDAPENPGPPVFELHQNVPNPFNPSTVIRYDVPAGGGKVTIGIYDAAGRLVRMLVDGPQTAGAIRVVWDGRNDSGEHVATGVYFCRMTAPGFSRTKKVVIVR